MKVDTFEAERPTLLALGYRMLGDMARAEEIVQDAWLRWQRSETEVETPRAFLLTVVTRLCLDELDSARQRHEQARSDRLPELVDLSAAGLEQLELSDEISVAFLVLLQRLTPAERAVFLLHDVFELGHAEIGALLGKKDDACRQLLRRAREHVAEERRSFETSREEHDRLLVAFFQAIGSGDQSALQELLVEDAVLVVDPGPGDVRVGRFRKLGRPVFGRRRILALLAAFREAQATPLRYTERVLNGRLAMVATRDGTPLAAVTVAVAAGRIRRLYFQADPARLRYLGGSN